MATQISALYTVVPVGTVSAATYVTRMAAVPIDQDLLNYWGLYLLTDSTTRPGNTPQRQLVVKMTPSTTATATAAIGVGVTGGSPIRGLTITNNGLYYVGVPTVTIADPTGSGATAYAQMGLFGGTVPSWGSEGTGYTNQTTITVVGGNLAPGGVQATVAPVLEAGGVAGVQVLTNGGPYTVPPRFIITDPGGGSGAVLVAQLGVSNLVLVQAGSGYTAPTVTITPLFKALCPDGTNQAATIKNFMSQIFRNQLLSPILAGAPVVS